MQPKSIEPERASTSRNTCKRDTIAVILQIVSVWLILQPPLVVLQLLDLYHEIPVYFLMYLLTTPVIGAEIASSGNSQTILIFLATNDKVVLLSRSLRDNLWS